MVLFNPDDDLSELIPLDKAPEIAQVSARTLRRWIAAKRLRVLAGHVIERELLAVEAERWASRTAGRPGARVSRAAVTGVTEGVTQAVTGGRHGCHTTSDL